MSRLHETVELRRAVAASSRSSTPATSPRRQTTTPRKMSRPPSATPGGLSGTPASSRTPARRGLAAPPRSERARLATRTCSGVHSEPSSPRGGASCSTLQTAESEPPPALDDSPLPPADDASTSDAQNIRVFVRVRPLNAREAGGSGKGAIGAAGRTCVSCPASGGSRVVVLSDPARQEPLQMTYDQVFGPEVGQEEVYMAVGAQMVENCMAGFNSSVFVYGMTGAGKTHTITGDVERADDGTLPEQCGLTLRVFRHLFDRITQEEREGVRYTVKCYYAEVYNEEVSDLLAPANSGLQIRDGDQHQGVYVEGLSEHVVVNADDVMLLVQKGSANRHTASTRMNERSSRSHSVFTAVVEAHEEQAESGVTKVRFSKLSLIDLAGSERVSKSGATGGAMTEAKAINKSLTTLGRVVMALTERQQHVPYRDSKLTFLLKESLGGNSKTSIVACVSPSEDSVQETHSTLLFAAGAKKIRNRAVVNQDTVGDMKALQLENARLQRELAKRDDALAAELRQQLVTAQAQAAAAEERVAAAEEWQQQLEVALNENHAALQQRNAEVALLKKELEDSKATCQLLQKDREQLIDHNAALTERVEGLQRSLHSSSEALRASQQEAAAVLERCEAASSAQHAAEDAVRSLQHDNERLASEVARVTTELEATRHSLAAELKQATAALEESERAKKLLKREIEQLLSDLRKRQREVADTQELAAAREERLRGEIAELAEAVSARSAQLQELEGKLAAETVCTAKYRRMVGEIGKLIDWAQSTSPLPPTLGGRTSPAGYPSLMPFGSGRLSFGGGAGQPVSPLGDATNLRGTASTGPRPLTASPGGKWKVQVLSPAGRSPLQSPSKVR